MPNYYRCTSCGHVFEGGTKFCPCCGARLTYRTPEPKNQQPAPAPEPAKEVAPAPEPAPAPAPVQEPVIVPEVKEEPVKENKALKALQEAAGSKFVTFLAVLATIALIASIAIGGILNFAAAIVSIVGIWLVVAMGKRKTQSLKGIKCLQAAVVLLLIETIVVQGAMVTLDVFAKEWIALAIDGVALLIGVLYYASIASLLSNARHILSGEEVEKVGGAFAGVMQFFKIPADLSLGLVFFIFNAALVEYVKTQTTVQITEEAIKAMEDALPIVGIVCLCIGAVLAIFDLFCGIAIFKYRGKVKRALAEDK